MLPRFSSRAASVSKAVAAALALFAGAAASAEPPVRSLLEIRQANMVAQRWDASCGAAALASVLTYHLAYPVTEKSVAEAMLGRTDPLRVKLQGGFSLLDLKRYAEARGFQAEGYLDLDLDELAELGPAIVPVIFHGYPHFVVYRGRVADRVLIADPAFGQRAVEVVTFADAWQKIAFVVSRPNAPAAAPSPAIQQQDRIRPTDAMIRRAVSR